MNLFKNWDYYFWTFQNFLWKHPPTQMKVWCSLLKIHAAIGALSLRITEDRVKGTKWATNHIWRNPFLQTCDELMFCFPFSQSWSRLCCKACPPTRTEPTVLLDPSPWGHHVRQSEHASHIGCDSLDASPWSPVLPLQPNTLPDIKNEILSKTVLNAQQVPSSVTPAASDILYMVKTSSAWGGSQSKTRDVWIELGGESSVTPWSFSSVMKVCSNFTICDQSKPQLCSAPQFLL